jgi:glycosyltransferase involved in cell wall biosynthesis
VLALSRKGLRILAIEYTVLGRDLSAENGVRQFVALAKRGHSVVYMIARTSQFVSAERAHVTGFMLKAVPIRRVNSVMSGFHFGLLVLWHFLKSIGQFDAVVLDTYSFRALFPALFLCRAFDLPPALLLRVRSIPVEAKGFLYSLATSIAFTFSIELAARLTDRQAFISPLQARQCSDRFRISKKKVFAWPPCVDTDVFAPKPQAKEWLRNEVGLSKSDGLVVLYHGVLSKGRGIMELVQAFGILVRESVNVNLILLGSGPLEEELLGHVRAHCLDEVVKIHKPVEYSEVPEYVAACDAEIVTLPDHPWWRYQCPIKVLECLAMNKPLILSDIPANRWIVEDAPVAIFTKGTTAREIADGIRAFISARSGLVPELGREIALSFSADRIALMVERQVRAVLG